jgi:curved DNA-binding protein CbpA
MSQPLATEDVLQRFRDRIRRDLEHRPLDLDETTHRLRFAEALGRCGRGTYYELLDVEPDADEAEIHAAYQAVARLVHPDHTDRLGLRTRRGVAEVLFERATEAYLALSDPHRRSEYDRESGALEHRSPDERLREAKRLAEDLLERARRLADRDEYHDALSLLRQAVRADPESADCWALMGRCRAQNDRWLHMASDDLRTAVKLRPSSSEFRLALAEVEERRGHNEGALRLYRQILERTPDHAAAREAIERMEGGETGRSRRRWWGR